MIESIAKWKTGRAYSEGHAIEELYLGAIRVARVVTEERSNKIAGKSHSYSVFVYRVFLPGVGYGDTGFAWDMDEAQEKVETILLDWLTDAGLNSEEPAYAMPDEVVVLEGLKAPAPGSNKIIPLEPWRRDGERRPSTKTAKATKKANHSQRRALTRGQ